MYKYLLLALLSFCVFAPEASAVYDPASGRWLTRDPLAAPHSVGSLYRIGTGLSDIRQPAGLNEMVNLYQYVGGNPAVYTDPEGLERHVVALEGWGSSIGLSGRFVHSGSKLASDVSGLVPARNWHYFDWTQAGQAAEKVRSIVNRPNQECAYDTVIVMGFSNGGDRAHDVTRWVASDGIDVDLLFMIDPVPAGVFEGAGSLLFGRTYSAPSNATRSVNIYQRSGHPKGWPMTGADVNKKMSQTDLDTFIRTNGYSGSFLYHSIMPVHTDTRSLWREWVAKVPEVTIR